MNRRQVSRSRSGGTGRRGIAQGRLEKQHGEKLADAGGGEHPGRLAQEPGGARHQRDGGEALEHCQAEIEPPLEAGPGEGEVIVEDAAAEPGQCRAREHRAPAARTRLDAEARADHRGGEQYESEGEIGPVEPVADPGCLLTGPARVEACRRQPQPLEQQRVEDDRAGGGQREAAEIRRPEQAGHEQAEQHARGRVQREGEDDGHGGPRLEASWDLSFHAEERGEKNSLNRGSTTHGTV